MKKAWRSELLMLLGILALALAMMGQRADGVQGAGNGGSADAAAGTQPEMPRVLLNTDYVPPVGKTIAVGAGGDFQAALDQAQPGDTITLQAGATYTGIFTLPVKTGNSWIVIRTSAPDSALPPPGTRISPSYAGVMPKIVTPNVEAALETADGAHHYRFIGIEFAAAASAPFVYNLINLGREQTTLAQTPNNLIFDRVYIHGRPDFNLRRGIALNSASTAIIDSYISDCHEVGVDSQAIGGWNGPGPFKIVNNYLEGAGENVIFGGADPSIPNLVPSDIEFRRNYCFKPLSWRIEDPSYAGYPWGVKNLFELKNAQRVWIDGNIFEHNWLFGQTGIAILFTVRNQDGTAPWSVVQDITFTNNIVRRTASGVNILGDDNNNPSQRTNRIRIANNLFYEIDGEAWNGAGLAFQIVRGPQNLTIENNTVFQTGSVMTIDEIPSPGLIFRNNLIPHNEYGVKGDNRESGNDTLTTYFADAIFRRNGLIGANSEDYPTDNFFPATVANVNFVDYAAGDYRLASNSPYKNAGTDGRDIGCDIDSMNAAINRDGFEADVSPRTGGSGSVQVTDWVQAGRFAAGLDTPLAGSEFRRADSAPRGMLGDGQVTIADWVQAGRYAAGLDSMKQTGGPLSPPAASSVAIGDLRLELDEPARDLRVKSMTLPAGEDTVEVPVSLTALGGESGIGMTIAFNPAILSYAGYSPGRDTRTSATIVANPLRARTGKVGFALALRTGESFVEGEAEVILVRFRIVGRRATTVEIGIENGPTPLGLSDVDARPVPVRPLSGKLKILATPARRIDLP